MIVYSETKDAFLRDVRENRIASKLREDFIRTLGYRTSESEFSSWKNSLNFMKNALEDDEIPADSAVALEYRIPRTGKRIDCIIAGGTDSSRPALVIVELKQWSTVQKTPMDGVIRTFIGGGLREVEHPSYQAWLYAHLLRNFNAAVDEFRIEIHACAYLHNCASAIDVRDPFYADHLAKAPLFLEHEAPALTGYIKNRIRKGDTRGVLPLLESGKIRPSPALADALLGMMRGNSAFLMVDEQKVVFENAKAAARRSASDRKNVLIVDGGPGSGKSVVAINLLADLLTQGLNARYVSKNAAPRAVYQQKLTGSFRSSEISNLFVGSGGFHAPDTGSFDALIVDEAHRLNLKSGLYGNLGENQVQEIVRSANFSLFMVDEDQIVTLRDIGTVDEIKRAAKAEKAKVHELKLGSQFRCNGSSTYLEWLDERLQIRERPAGGGHLDFRFEVVESPERLHDLIRQLNSNGSTARLVAGYCWEWKSKRDSSHMDIRIGEGFSVQWNLSYHGSAWIAHPDSVHQAGCIHTCQGLEVDFIGVIVGPDLVVRDGKVVTVPGKRARSDQSLKGRNKIDPATSADRCARIIKNTYKTLMTRGSRGCFVYAEDRETSDHFRFT